MVTLTKDSLAPYPVVTAATTSVRSWWPSRYEFFAFFFMIILLFILISLFHNNSIQNKVRKESRCYKEKTQNRIGGVFTVTATNAMNNDLYRVNYDMGGKQFSVECACKEGKVTNRFQNIPVYNLQTNTPDTINEKLCNCETDLISDSPNVYYKGYPGIVRFMNSKDTTFFTSDPL